MRMLMRIENELGLTKSFQILKDFRFYLKPNTEEQSQKNLFLFNSISNSQSYTNKNICNLTACFGKLADISR